MADFIKTLHNKLLLIRTYLIKLGPSRRKGKILSKKLAEANEIVLQYNTYVENITKILDLKDKEEKISFNTCCLKFQLTIQEIRDLCRYSGESTEKESGEQQHDHQESGVSSSSSESESEETCKMEKFDLKVALNLLPVMTDKETNTKELIDSIVYYSSILDETSKKSLISFVLSTRLSQSAKLKLSCKYEKIENLIQDMRKLLLPQKSATAIQTKLQNIRQNERSVIDFGKEISELFVDLTISQADGNPEHFNVLRPLNEKFAIKRFADGLRNSRLSTIIASRNFNDLKDAIQVAQEEETASSSEYVTSMSYRSRGSSRGFYRGSRNTQGYRGRWNHTRPPPSYNQPYFSNNQRGKFRGRPSRGRYTFDSDRSSNYQPAGHVHTMNPQHDTCRPVHEPNEPASHPDIESLNHFFRA